MNRFQEKVSFIWGLADLLRGDYRQSEYANVILPFTVLRRLSGQPNASGIGFTDLARTADRVPRYLAGFSPDVRHIFECFRFTEQVSRLRRAGLLSLLIERLCEIDLQPESVSNHEMGYIFEELIRKFSCTTPPAVLAACCPRQRSTCVQNIRALAWNFMARS